MKRILFSFFILITVSCSKDENKNFEAKNDQEIKAYISEHNLNAQKTASGLYYVINETGSGEHPTPTSNVTVAYKGYFTDGNVFDKSDSDGISFGLHQVIKGWTEGITYFKEGGSGMLLIPSHLGYGANGRPGIPGGAVLIFDINLIQIN